MTTKKTVVTIEVLQVITAPTVRKDTATEAAWNAIIANVGHTKEDVLMALKEAEEQWHKIQGKKVEGVAPSGWLRKFKPNVKFVPQKIPTVQH